MTVSSNANDRPFAQTRATSVQTYARIAAVLFLLSAIGGGLGEAYIPSRLVVSGDAAATATNITALDSLFRIGFATYLVEATCDIALSLVFYVLLRPVHRNLALLAAFFGLVSTSVFAVAEFFYFAPKLILSGSSYLTTFSPGQLNSLALLSLKCYEYCGGLFMLFYGVASIIRGYLIFRSGYFPRFLGVLLVIAGLGFIARNLALVLAPQYASDAFLLPTFVAGISLMLWLFVKGVDVPQWEAKTLPLRTTV